MWAKCNFFRYEDELVAVYKRFGTAPFAYRDVADIVPKRVMSHLMHRGFLVVHKSAQSSRRSQDKFNYWRLHSEIAASCQNTIQGAQ